MNDNREVKIKVARFVLVSKERSDNYHTHYQSGPVAFVSNPYHNNNTLLFFVMANKYQK